MFLSPVADFVLDDVASLDFLLEEEDGFGSSVETLDDAESFLAGGIGFCDEAAGEGEGVALFEVSSIEEAKGNSLELEEAGLGVGP